jgi:hypothetical protein
MIYAATRHFLSAIAVRLAAWLLIVAWLVPRPAQAEMIWGANGHPFTAYPGITQAQQLGYLHDLGLKSYRVNISDLSSAPALGELIAKAEPFGIAILPVLTPALDFDSLPAETLRRRAHEFAYALITRFKEKVRVWELGNEVENYAIIKACEMQDDGVQYNCAWGPAGGVGPLDYYGPRWAKVSAVLKGLSEGAIAADAAARKAMGTAGWGHVGAFERMRQDGIAWDISVWHMYGEDPEWAFKALAAHGRPIWVTEMNHPLGSQKSEAEQAQGLTRWMKRLDELAHAYKVEAVHIYELMDETYWLPNAEAVMGLVRLEKTPAGGWRPGAPKPAYDAVREIVRGVPARAEIRRDCQLAPLAGQSLTRGQVEYLYCLLLGRKGNEQGLRYWTERREKGASMRTALLEMAASDEFATRGALAYMSDRTFVAWAYRLLLDRDVDGQGLADYSAELKDGRLTRPGLLKTLLESDEFKARHKVLFDPA